MGELRVLPFYFFENNMQYIRVKFYINTSYVKDAISYNKGGKSKRGEHPFLSF